MEKTDIEVLHELVAPAKKALSPETWDYLMGAGETETTFDRNRLGLDSLAFRPRVLRDVSKVSLRTRFLGHDMRLPVILAPIGSIDSPGPSASDDVRLKRKPAVTPPKS